jgi:hypothetical protein
MMTVTRRRARIGFAKINRSSTASAIIIVDTAYPVGTELPRPLG